MDIPYLKKEALVPVNIGVGYVKNLTEVIGVLFEGKTPEQVKMFQSLVAEKRPLTEPWMVAVETIHSLIRTVYTEGERLGMVERRPIDGAATDIPQFPQSPQRP